MDHLLANLGDLHTRHHVLQSLLTGYTNSELYASDPNFLDKWILLQVEKALGSVGTCCSEDACALMEIGANYDVNFFKTRHVTSIPHDSTPILT